MTRRAALGLLLPVALTGLLTAGCVVRGPTTAAGGNSLGTSATNPQPRDALRDGGNMRFAITEMPENYNTEQVDGASADMAFIAGAVLPTAFTADESGRLAVNHAYFTDIALLPGSPQRVAYTLNPKAVWSDGSPITWQDLRSQAAAASGADPRYQVATTSGYNQVATVTEGVDDRQAILTFAKPYNGWLGLFSYLLPHWVNDSPDAFNNAYRTALPISGGPFLVSDIDKVQGRVTLRRNPRWWGAKPALDTMTFLALDSADWVPALRNNEIDATDMPVNSLSMVTAARNATDVDVRRAPDPSVPFLTFNGAPGSALADAALRRAVARAIDRRSIARALQFGLTDNPQPLNNHIYLAGQPGFGDNAAAVAYDRDAAARELDALGWRRVGDGRVKDGRRLVIRFALRASQTNTEIAEIVQQNLSDVGVKVDLEDHPASGFFSDVITPGDFDIALFVWAYSDFPLVPLNQLYSWNPANPQSNFGHIGNRTINDLIDQALSELDPVKATTLANRVDTLLFEEVFSLPLYQSAGNYPVRSSVANYGATGLATVDYTAIGFQK